MAEPSPFDQYVKEFELRLQLIKTMGQWNKDMAEAEVNWANARMTDAKTKTINLINSELKKAMLALAREERAAEMRLKKAQSLIDQTKRFVSGRKPPNTTILTQSWSALDWFLGEADTKAVREMLAIPIGEQHRTASNFIAISITLPNVEEAPATLRRMGELRNWMREKRYFFVDGSDVHDLYLQGFDLLAKSRETVIQKLEEKSASAGDQSYTKMRELRVFLGLPPAAEKTPSIAMSG